MKVFLGIAVLVALFCVTQSSRFHDEDERELEALELKHRYRSLLKKKFAEMREMQKKSHLYQEMKKYLEHLQRKKLQKKEVSKKKENKKEENKKEENKEEVNKKEVKKNEEESSWISKKSEPVAKKLKSSFEHLHKKVLKHLHSETNVKKSHEKKKEMIKAFDRLEKELNSLRKSLIN